MLKKLYVYTASFVQTKYKILKIRSIVNIPKLCFSSTLLKTSDILQFSVPA